MILRRNEQGHARRFFRNRPHRLKTIALLPSLITLINGICGFTAIGLMSRGPSFYDDAAYMIFYAMIADMLDGRLARMSKTTSSFGGQLDSLCDVISFGAAPAFLMLGLLLHHHRQLVGSADLFLGDFFERFIWLAAITYLSCAAVRLARFNVENEEDETAHMSFTGLPSPASAGVIAALVLYSEYLISDRASGTPLFQFLHQAILYVLPFVTFGCGFLMVSRVRYPHLFNKMFRGRKPVTYLYFAIFVAGMLYLCGLQLSLVLTFSLFALSGVVKWLWVFVSAIFFGRASEATQPAHAGPHP